MVNDWLRLVIFLLKHAFYRRMLEEAVPEIDEVVAQFGTKRITPQFDASEAAPPVAGPLTAPGPQHKCRAATVEHKCQRPER